MASPAERVMWEEARQAAIEVLLHNARGPYQGLMRTAGWGYPEPYTRDLMIAAFGMAVSGEGELIDCLRRVLLALAENQSRLGHIPSLAHDPTEVGASDTTPLFLIGLELYRRASGEKDFLAESAVKALTWMDHQSPGAGRLITQMPTSDWRDEQWVPGNGLYVNALALIYLRFYGREGQAEAMRRAINRADFERRRMGVRIPEGLRCVSKPYYALWSYKWMNSERFDLLGNSLAILGGAASSKRAGEIIDWVEEACEDLRQRGELRAVEQPVGELPPCLLPFIYPGEEDWRSRYAQFNRPGEYHNGGVWPFVCGFYIAALVKAGRQELAESKLSALAEAVRKGRDPGLSFGFNEWLRAQDGLPIGQDWQTWSAGMYLYACEAVRRGRAPFFEAGD
jgi:Alkaline and neutral invertase